MTALNECAEHRRIFNSLALSETNIRSALARVLEIHQAMLLRVGVARTDVIRADKALVGGMLIGVVLLGVTLDVVRVDMAPVGVMLVGRM